MPKFKGAFGSERLVVLGKEGSIARHLQSCLSLASSVSEFNGCRIQSTACLGDRGIATSKFFITVRYLN